MCRDFRVSSSWAHFSWLTAFVFWLMALTSANASFRTFKWIEPTDYASRSKRFVLHVDPADRFGAGAATYTMADRGKVLWQRRHHFTLFDAAVTDTGHVVGYTYSGGPSGRGGPGSFSVILLDERGGVVGRDTYERDYTCVSSTNPVPEADGIVLSEPAGRFIVRVPRDVEAIEAGENAFTFPSVRETGERLWVYDLATGKRQKVLASNDVWSPKGADSERLESDPFHDVRAVPKTPLFLLHCDFFECDEDLVLLRKIGIA